MSSTRLRVGPRPGSVRAGWVARCRTATEALGARCRGRWRQGVTAIETALIMPPFLLLCFGIIEVSMLYFVATALEGQVALASRQIRTGAVQNSGDPVGEFRKLLCEGTTFIKCADLILDVRNFGSFGQVNYPEYFDSDGEANGNQFLPGGSGDIVLVRVAYKWEITTPFLNVYLGDGGGTTKLLHSAAVFKTEPYDR
mgnify:CR=1 FL=1